eukprot:scaffold4482_cov393-Prasinococcus_capsulatus_cf.AAC.7
MAWIARTAGCRFDFPTWVLILLSIVNDFTVMATSKDAVRSSKEPLHFKVGRTMAISGIIGASCIVHTFLLLYLSLPRQTSGIGGFDWWGSWALDSLEECEVVAVVYLGLAITIQLNIFSTRNNSFFLDTKESTDGSPPPSIILCLPVFGSLVFSTFISVYWPREAKLGGGAAMKGCGWGPAGVVWLWCLIWFFIADFAKVLIIRYMDDEMTGLIEGSIIGKLLGISRNKQLLEKIRSAQQSLQRRAFEQDGGLDNFEGESQKGRRASVTDVRHSDPEEELEVRVKRVERQLAEAQEHNVWLRQAVTLLLQKANLKVDVPLPPAPP